MYKRMVSIVTCALFTLLALLAIIITDLNDRDYPQHIGVTSRVNLDFSESNLSINEAFETLVEFDELWNLGLVKVLPDLDDNNDNNDNQVFAMLNDGDLPNTFSWFSGDEGNIVGKDRLTHSYPDGDFLVTGKNPQLNKFEDHLNKRGVIVTREDASILKSLEYVVWERGFATAVLAAFTLIVTLALFWFSIKSRSRALRVLGGSPTLRIQLQDLVGFIGLLFMSAIIVALIALSYIGLFHGWVYTGPFLKILFAIQFSVIVVSLLTVLLLSAFAWPSAIMLATRQPAVKSIRSAAIMIQALTFILVITAATPAWDSYKHSNDIATEMAQWKQLADQAEINFATNIGEMDLLEKEIGELVKEAESLDMVSLTYTYTEETRNNVDFGEYSSLSMVNQAWIDLVTKGASHAAVKAVAEETISVNLLKMMQEDVEILLREQSNKDILSTFHFFRPVEGVQLPIGQGGGGATLYFTEDVLLVVVPSLYQTYNDSSLTSMVSSGNISFTGVTATQKLLEEQGLDVQSLRNRQINGELKVVHIAEEGILRAQYAAYVSWLQGLSLIALVIAFTLATIINGLINARLQAKNDFTLRVAGQSWLQIIKKRLIKEILIGLVLIAIVLIWQRPDPMGMILLVVTYALFILLLCHFIAVKKFFSSVSKRHI